MIVTAHQPAYLPWLGYFEKISRSDVYVYLDTVQFEARSFINRNKIKTPQGPQWLTIPVMAKGHQSSSLAETFINETQNWRNKHLKAIELNYCKAPHFKEAFPKIERIISCRESRLVDFCWHELAVWLSEFEIRTKVVRLSELPVATKKSDLILDLCRHFNADHYISGALGRNYLDEAAFREAGIEVEYQDFQHPIYPQLWGEFEPYLSVVDFWMNCGATPSARRSGDEL